MSSVETKQKPKFISKFKPLADIRPLIEEGDLLEIQEAVSVIAYYI